MDTCEFSVAVAAVDWLLAIPSTPGVSTSIVDAKAVVVALDLASLIFFAKDFSCCSSNKWSCGCIQRSQALHLLCSRPKGARANVSIVLSRDGQTFLCCGKYATLSCSSQCYHHSKTLKDLYASTMCVMAAKDASVISSVAVHVPGYMNTPRRGNDYPLV